MNSICSQSAGHKSHHWISLSITRTLRKVLLSPCGMLAPGLGLAGVALPPVAHHTFPAVGRILFFSRLDTITPLAGIPPVDRRTTASVG
jgi:hypothetical protein